MAPVRSVVGPGQVDRRFLLRWGALAGGALASGAVLAGCGSDEDTPTPSTTRRRRSPTPRRAKAPSRLTPAQALSRLKEGNARFVAGKPEYPDQSEDYRKELAAGQHPFAQVLSCVDSRVPPELLFDQGFGDLFVTRSAGQVVDRAVRGSLQFGVHELEIPLLVVLGHEKCGAVNAALEAVEKKSKPLGNDIDALVAGIRPAVAQAEKAEAADPLDAAVRYNVANIVAALGADELLAEAVGKREMRIVGARYDLDTGSVTFL